MIIALLLLAMVADRSREIDPYAVDAVLDTFVAHSRVIHVGIDFFEKDTKKQRRERCTTILQRWIKSKFSGGGVCCCRDVVREYNEPIENSRVFSSECVGRAEVDSREILLQRK